MLTLTTLSGVLIEVHDDVRTLTAARYQRFCAQYLLYSVGTDLFQAEGHVGRMNLFLTGRDYEALRLEFNSFVLALDHVRTQTSGPAHVLACLVKSIDGVEVTDLSDSGLKDTAKILLAADVSQFQLTDTLDQAKKNLSATS